MKKKVLFGILAALVLSAGAIFVVAQKGMNRGGGPGFGPGGGHGGRHMAGMMLRGLDLTDEQKAKVKEIMDASRASVEPLVNQMKESRGKLQGLGADGKFDQAAVEALANDQGTTMAKLIVERERAKAQVFALLTDEQKAKAAELRQKHQERMRDGKGFGGMRGPGGF